MGMKIVVLDGYTLNPGDLNWEPLAALGDLEIHARTAPGDVLARAAGAQILLTNKTALGASHFANLPALKYIGVLATGYNVVDVKAAAIRGIPVTNVPTYGTASVAQLAFAHILNWCHHVAEHAQGVRNGKWCTSVDFCYQDFPLIELADQTIGLIGLGRIGQATARLAQAFGMNVMAYDTAFTVSPMAGVQLTALDKLLGQSDFVSLHCPLTDATTGMIHSGTLAKMKPTAFLVNTSRGALIDEPALAEALNAGTISGAGLDVLVDEPAKRDNPLLSARNCFITPHLAWATRSARQRLLQTATENAKAFLDGRPQNVINGVGTSTR
jgi:glycerate dehydrogenase